MRESLWPFYIYNIHFYVGYVNKQYFFHIHKCIMENFQIHHVPAKEFSILT
jgi:hypothetical protein